MSKYAGLAMESEGFAEAQYIFPQLIGIRIYPIQTRRPSARQKQRDVVQRFLETRIPLVHTALRSP